MQISNRHPLPLSTGVLNEGKENGIRPFNVTNLDLDQSFLRTLLGNFCYLNQKIMKLQVKIMKIKQLEKQISLTLRGENVQYISK